MQKYLIFLLVLAVVFLAGYYLIYFEGVFYPADAEPEVLFRTEGTQYQRQTGPGTYETMIFQSVDMSASIPGYAATQFALTEEDYLRWFTKIGELGANLVRATTVMDAAFYNALYTYNTTQAEPLYLMQGSSVSDRANTGAEDCYGTAFYDVLIEDGRNLVDIIHGRKNILLSTGKGSGIYRRDISPWVVGWLVGMEWNPGTVAYSDHRAIDDAGFSGTYFTTTADCTRFETMLAKVMDEVTRYETVKYGVQRPIAFANSQTTDFLEFEEAYARQLEKYAYIDSEHILATEKMLAGQFAAYSLFDYCDDYAKCLSQEMRREFASVLAALPQDALFGGYLQIMAAHHTMPVVAAGYGLSTGRNPERLDVEPLTEAQQGHQILAVYNEAVEAGWSGVSISTWQDTWERMTWNNAFSVDATTNNLWHDMQSNNQHYGLMTFVPKETVCTLDGEIGEWTQEDQLLTSGGISLSVRYDLKGIYLMLSGLTQNQKLYIPMDVTPETGSMQCSDPALAFSRAADFLLCIDGTDNTRLLAQDRYDARRANFGMECDLVDFYSNEPPEDSDKFVPVTLAVRNPYLLDPDQWRSMEAVDREKLLALGVYETGHLLHGSQDPESSQYTTLADFCFGENCVEIRLPWNMVNVGNPADREIHRDYFDHFGVELERCDGIWFGIQTESDTAAAEMSCFQWDGWKTITFDERLKDSYYVIQRSWR